MNKEKVKDIGFKFGYACGMIIMGCLVAIVIAFAIRIVCLILGGLL